MKWQNLTPAQVEISFNSGTKVLSINKQHVAAILVLPNGSVHYLQTTLPLSQLDYQHVQTWLGDHPKLVKHVEPSAFNQIISKESQNERT